MSLRILIADDEPLARSRLRVLVEELGHEVCAEAGDTASAERELRRTHPDLLLLDIEMPRTDGLTLARRIELAHPEIAVVLVTAHAEHAVAAFDAAVTDYVLKPIRKERLEQALRKVEVSRLQSKPSTLKIRLTLGRREQLVPLDEIDYFSAEDSYVVAHSARFTAFVDARLGDLEAQHGDSLIRVHRSYLAVRDSVTGLETISASDHRLTFRDGMTPIPVSRRQLRMVREFLIARAQQTSIGKA
jgi:two-component system, LytTR family, response regulator AlgR